MRRGNRGVKEIRGKARVGNGSTLTATSFRLTNDHESGHQYDQRLLSFPIKSKIRFLTQYFGSFVDN